MSGTPGRPKKEVGSKNIKQSIIDATIKIIKKGTASDVTVRNVCKTADVSTGTFYHYFKNKDDLLMYFIKDSIFPNSTLSSPQNDPAGRIIELYSLLIEQYMSLGEDFMNSFYTTDNTALSVYLGQADGKFMRGSIMEKSEQELNMAVNNGYLNNIHDIHQAAADICTIVKGCVFEWCLSKNKIDLKATLERIIRKYLA